MIVSSPLFYTPSVAFLKSCTGLVTVVVGFNFKLRHLYLRGTVCDHHSSSSSLLVTPQELLFMH